MHEPDLDAPGKPLKAKIEVSPGVWEDYPIEQTKRNNLQDLCTIMGGEDKVTREAVEAYGLEWREWVEFVLEMHDHQHDQQEHIASEVARIEATTGKKVELPKLRKDRLGLLHLEEEPEQTPPAEEPEPNTGREPPPDTSWG